MDESTVGRFMAEARACALLMMENAAYIQGELADVHMDQALRAETERLCSGLIGTKHDVISELFQLDEILETDATAPAVSARVDLIMRWLAEDMRDMHALVSALRSASREDPESALAYVLVMESATNILNAFHRTCAAAESLGGGEEEAGRT